MKRVTYLSLISFVPFSLFSLFSYVHVINADETLKFKETPTRLPSSGQIENLFPRTLDDTDWYT